MIGSRRRRITPVEAGRLQGLPDHVFPNAGVDDATAYKQAGNGVNVGTVQFVAAHLFSSAGVKWGEQIVESTRLLGGSSGQSFDDSGVDEEDAA